MRPKRLRRPELFYHIVARGNNQQNIFEADEERILYLDLMKKYFSRHKIRVISYVLMTNHVHFLVQDVDGGQLEKAMHKLQGTYAQKWNRKHSRKGHLWEDRYYASPVEEEIGVLWVSVYIHLNPVRAGIVSRPQDYPWSSMGSYLSTRGRKVEGISVWTQPIFRYCDRREYKKILQEDGGYASDLFDEKGRPDSKKVRGLKVVGSEVYSRYIEPFVERRVEYRPQGFTLDDIFEKVCQESGVSSSALCSRSRKREYSYWRGKICFEALREGISVIDLAKKLKRTRAGILWLAREYEKMIKMG